MKKCLWCLVAVIITFFTFSCTNPADTTSDDTSVDISTLPASNATPVASSDEAKTIYTEASSLLYDGMESGSKGVRILPKAMSRGTQTLNESFNWSNEYVTITGTQKGTITDNFPTTMTPGTYEVMNADVDFAVDGTMTNLTVNDPYDVKKQYVISGTIQHEMSMTILMNLVIGSGSPPSFTPSGNFEMSVKMVSAYTIKRVWDGKGAKFVLTFSDTKKFTIDPGTAGSGNGGMGDPTCGYFNQNAKLSVYDDSGAKILSDVDVPLADIPWMMGNMVGAGGGAGGPPGGGSGGTTDPIELPASVAADAGYASYEASILTKINSLRASGATFASTDADLNALARRYAQVGKMDMPDNLIDRIVGVGVGCSDAAFAIGGGTLLDSKYVETISSNWSTTMIGDTAFTKVGIGMALGDSSITPPGTSWHSAVVLFVKP